MLNSMLNLEFHIPKMFFKTTNIYCVSLLRKKKRCPGLSQGANPTAIETSTENKCTTGGGLVFIVVVVAVVFVMVLLLLLLLWLKTNLQLVVVVAVM
jgi:hypothetical protein